MHDSTHSSDGILRGPSLERACADVPRLRREAFSQLWAHVTSPASGRILALAGPQWTGKTTLMLQAIAALPKSQRAATAFIYGDPRLSVNDLAEMADSGVTHLFIDHALKLSEGMRHLSILPKFAGKMVLTLAHESTLFLRLAGIPGLEVLRLSHIPAREHMRLLGTHFRECIATGGRLGKQQRPPWKRHDAVEDAVRRVIIGTDMLMLEGACPRHLPASAKPRWASSVNESCIDKTLKYICYQKIIEAARQVFPHEPSIAEPWKMLVMEEFPNEKAIRRHLRCLELEDVLAACPEEDLLGRCGTRWTFLQPYMYLNLLDRMNARLKLKRHIDDWGKRHDVVVTVVEADAALDVTLADLLRAAPDTVRVASLKLPGVHRAMLVSDMRRRRCALFTVTMDTPCSRAARPLREPAVIASLTHRHGAVVRQVALHPGPTSETDGILWQNAEEFLCQTDNPAYLDWVCRFDQEHAPAAPVNRSARRFRMPSLPSAGMKGTASGHVRFERDTLFDGLKLAAPDMHALNRDGILSVTLPEGHFRFKAAFDECQVRSLAASWLNLRIMALLGLPAPMAHLGRIQGLTVLLADDATGEQYLPADLPLWADRDNDRKNFCKALAWAQAKGVESAFLSLFVADTCLNVRHRPAEFWGVAPDGEYAFRLALRAFDDTWDSAPELSFDEFDTELCERMEDIFTDDDSPMLCQRLLRSIQETSRRLNKVSGEAAALADWLARQRFISAKDSALWKATLEYYASESRELSSRCEDMAC